MKLTCKTCGRVYESLIIDKVMAWNECYTKLCTHALKAHPDMVASLQVELQKVFVSVTAYMTVTNLAVVPEDEKYINLLIDEFQKEIMYAAGFEEGEEDGEEEESDDEEGEDDTEQEIVTPSEHEEEPEEQEVILDGLGEHKKVS